MTCALTTVAHVKEWLGIAADSTDSDDNIRRLIQSASTFILSNIQRSTVCVQEYSESYDGNGKNWMLLKQWPVLAVANIYMPGQTITGSQQLAANVFTGQGFKVSPSDTPDQGPQRMTLLGYCFPLGRDSVNVVYTAGFQQVDELTVTKVGESPDFIYTVTLTQTWLEDIGVKDEFGLPMVKVAANPAVGEYAVSAEGVYTFNSAAENDVVTITYSYVPADLEEAAYQLVGEGIRYQSRIGVKSKTLGGQETIVYDNSWMTQSIDLLLQNYRRVAPI